MSNSVSEAMLNEAMVESFREEKKLRDQKSDYDGKMNNKIGLENRKQKAILEEIDALRAGRQDHLPFTDGSWKDDDAAGKKREKNV